MWTPRARPWTEASQSNTPLPRTAHGVPRASERIAASGIDRTAAGLFAGVVTGMLDCSTRGDRLEAGDTDEPRLDDGGTAVAQPATTITMIGTTAPRIQVSIRSPLCRMSPPVVRR